MERKLNLIKTQISTIAQGALCYCLDLYLNENEERPVCKSFISFSLSLVSHKQSRNRLAVILNQPNIEGSLCSD